MKSKHHVTDPNERVVTPHNSSRSFANGGGVMRHVERSLADHRMDVAGGGKLKGRPRLLSSDRSLEQHAKDVEAGGKDKGKAEMPPKYRDLIQHAREVERGGKRG